MLWTLPVISAIVGWFTNYLAVKMLFYPKEPWDFKLFKIQGIFPKNQRQVAEKIGKMVADELLSSDDLRDKMHNPENLLSINQIVEAKIDYFLNVKFPKQYPITGLLFTEKRKAKMKGELMVEVKESVPQVIDHYMSNLEERFNVEEIIKERVAVLPAEKLEGLIMNLLKKEFKFIEYIGAVVGFLIGLIQVALVSLGQ
ncbi:MAG: DUF445 family protein [Flavobacteriales bacterium]|nr:DUF445 family protein [Flavobacteriales bacterium]